MPIGGYRHFVVVCCAIVGCLVSAAGVLASARGEIVVSQKNRKFDPGAITIAKDQPIVIVNDDGTLMHHAYVEADTFNFDSGDQKPGSRTTLAFPVRGDFTVLCGIHPKMTMTVHVK